MCNGGTDDWSMIQLAGMVVVAEQLRSTVNISPVFRAQLALLKQFLGLNQFFTPDEMLHDFPLRPIFMFADPVPLQPWHISVVFPGTGDRKDLAFAIENVAPFLIAAGLSAVIPFYGFARAFFFETIETEIAQILEQTIAGPNRLSLGYWIIANTISTTIFDMFTEQPWFQRFLFYYTNQTKIQVTAIVGHGCYGTIAKGLAGQYLLPGFAFQSSQFQRSPVSVFQDWDDAVGTNGDWRLADIRSQIPFQVFAPDMAISGLAGQLPDLESGIVTYFKTPRALETFCLIVAGCATTSRYDSLCDQLLGSAKRHQDMFQLWGRNWSRQFDRETGEEIIVDIHVL
jgi:hypothetical protein